MQDGHAPRGRLSDRQIQFIAIGGGIGAGLFVGSGQGILAAGPSVIFAYLISCVCAYIMARALGEMTLNHVPVPTFVYHVEAYVGGNAAFITGWSYWLLWVLAGVFEVSSIGIMIHLWLPNLPQWISAATLIVVLYAINCAKVSVFGEIEFWLTLLKVITIVAVIAGGTLIAFMGTGHAGSESSFSNLWTHGGVFPHGVSGMLSALAPAFFAFGGVELIGITAGDAQDPRKSVPRAIRGVIIRMLLLYIGSLIVIMAVAPWNSLTPGMSPFVMVFNVAGIPAAASLINMIVLVAIISASNSGIFATGRMLYAMAKLGDAPALLAHTNSSGVPMRAVTFSAASMFALISLNYFVPNDVIAILISLVAALVLWAWTMILIAHYRYRRGLVREPPAAGIVFQLPLFPWSSAVAFGIIALVIFLMAENPGTRITLYSACAWFTLIGVVGLGVRRARRRAPASAAALGNHLSTPG